MAKQASEASPGELMSAIVSDAEKLLQQQFDLLRSELREEFQKARDAAVPLGVGVGLLAVGSVLSTQMLVHFLHRHTRLPLWACYGLVGAALHAGGYGMICSGSKKAADVHWTSLPQTTAALQENLAWLKEQATTAPALGQT